MCGLMAILLQGQPLMASLFTVQTIICITQKVFLRKTVSRFRLPISASFLETLNNQAIDIVAILSRFCDYKWFWPGAVTNCDGLWLWISTLLFHIFCDLRSQRTMTTSSPESLFWSNGRLSPTSILQRSRPLWAQATAILHTFKHFKVFTYKLISS